MARIDQESLERVSLLIKEMLSAEAEDIHAFMAAYPTLPPMGGGRKAPSVSQLWRSYCESVVTIRTRVSPTFQDEILEDDEFLEDLFGNQRTNMPAHDVLHRHLADKGIVDAIKKAGYIRAAWNRDWDWLAKEIRVTMRDHHDKSESMRNLRQQELRLARMLQDELHGCGVGPKISRLMLRSSLGGYDSPLCHTIPLDTRWQNVLKDNGVQFVKNVFSNEKTYTQLEDAICSAAMDMGFPPSVADFMVFGEIRRFSRRNARAA